MVKWFRHGQMRLFFSAQRLLCKKTPFRCMLMLVFHSFLRKLFQKTCTCHGCVSWHLWTFLAQLTKERKPDRTELYVRQRVLRVQQSLGMKRNDPVKCITITCHYSVLLSSHSYDGKMHNDFCRFLGFRLEKKPKNLHLTPLDPFFSNYFCVTYVKG